MPKISYLLLHLVGCLVSCRSAQGLAAASLSTVPTKVSSFSEVSIDPNDVTEGKTLGERIKFGESIIEIPNLATPQECEYLITASLKAAEAEAASTSKRLLSEKASPGLVRLPTIAAYERAAATDTPCADPLPSDVDIVLRNILLRTAEYIDDELPSVTSVLFGTTTTTTTATTDDSLTLTLASLMANNYQQLKFSSREPAINVYTPGGQFLAHTDAQALTVLIPLSRPHDDFTGGGTAFWGQNARGHRVEPPSLVSKPMGGTALLFGGCVTHAGVAVEEGERVVFVASFSSI